MPEERKRLVYKQMGERESEKCFGTNEYEPR